MLRRCIVSLLAVLLLAAARAPRTVAPPDVPHPVAMFLANLSREGKQKITFKASALGTRFFLEEGSGVTVYAFDGTDSYHKEAFLKGYSLANAMKKYRK